MVNEVVFGIMTFLDLMFVVFMSRFSRMGLVGGLMINIVLVSVFGAKLVELFGLVTNVGNGFYALVFWCVTVVAVNYGEKFAYRAVWVGFCGIVLFMLMSQYVVRLEGVALTNQVSVAMEALFRGGPRIMLASMMAYLAAQNLNVWLLGRLGGKLWLRSSVSVGVAEIVDSMVFFGVAFAGLVEPTILVQSMVAGYGIKMLVHIVSVPFMYVNFLPKGTDVD